MRLVDAHCHLDQLDLNCYDGKLENALNAAKENDVCHMLCAGITIEAFPTVRDIATLYSSVSCAVGVQPSEQNCHEPSVEELIALADCRQVVGIGETGLDYYYSIGDLTWQRERFRRHIQAAKKIKKPLIVHLRQASDDLFFILKEESAEEIGGMMHCFTEDWETAKRAMDLNFYISFSGIVTFSKATVVQEVAKQVPLDRMLIETDSPYLAPVPRRGKPNEPAYVRYTAECLAKLREIDLETLAERTTENFFRLFVGAEHPGQVEKQNPG
jgi:TatD DNase family protein